WSPGHWGVAGNATLPFAVRLTGIANGTAGRSRLRRRRNGIRSTVPAQARTRSSPSFTMVGTRLPYRAHNRPVARARALDALGETQSYSSQSAARNGRRNHMAWSRLAPETSSNPQ